MRTVLILLVLLIGACSLLWARSRREKNSARWKASKRGPGPELLHSVVSASERYADPYPYIYVETDGTARELHAKERAYLATPFRPTDSGRPYIKSSYEEKNGWGEIRGFLHRSALPGEIYIAQAPLTDPHDEAENPEHSAPLAKVHNIR